MGYDAATTRDAASGRWKEIITQLGGVDPKILDGRHHPCPQCGGRDRFRFTDRKNNGSSICNQCRKNGDGFHTLAWLTNRELPAEFGDLLKDVAELLGVEPSKNGRKKDPHPEDNLEFCGWNDQLADMWCLRKPGITRDAVKAVGARIARYRNQWTVICWPVRQPGGEKIRGWVIQNLTGGTLPTYGPNGSVEYVDKKTLPGTKPGFIGTQNGGSRVIKTEGPSDLLSLISAGLGDDEDAICNVHGAKEDPRKTGGLAEYLAGKDVVVVHDADKPGQDGATDVSGRPGWAPVMASYADSGKLVQLPFPISATKGKDLRDYFAEGKTKADFDALVTAAPLFDQSTVSAIEADDDPHRLARINLERYAAQNHGATIRYWRDEWYIWKDSRYRKIPKDELSAKVNLSIKQEFDRLNIEQQKDPDQKKVKPTQKVTKTLISNILDATRGMTVIPSHIELGSVVDQATGIRERRNYISMENGILDVDSLLADSDDVIRPHSSSWFSTISLPYRFDPSIKCPRWNDFLSFNLEGDPERIAILQEWAGYCLLPDTGHQRFLVLEGQGANGKSVYFAALEAMLGVENVAHVPLEVFGDRFSKTQTLGKLANIAPDAGEIEKQSEGNLKSFTAGERMMFDRKGLAPIEAYPTARLMIGCNNRPRFSDKSDGIWRRMILIPFTVQVPAKKRIPNMDKAWWWEQSGELPGILMWAIVGLARLREQGKFSVSTKSDQAIDDYRVENNPAIQFFREHVEKDVGGFVTCAELYDRYKRWCSNNGYWPLSNGGFGRELIRLSPFCKRRQRRVGGGRPYCYVHVRYVDSALGDGKRETNGDGGDTF